MGGSIVGAPVCEDTLKRKVKKLIRFSNLHVIIYI